MSKTPMIGRVIDVSDDFDPNISDWHMRLPRGSSIDGHALATELRALLAERDALAAKLTPVRKLREIKGVTYSDDVWWLRGVSFGSVSLLVNLRGGEGFTDADHAAIYALREQPYEPVETVEEVFRERDLKDAPIGYSSDEARAWCSGYDMAIARIRALGVFGTAPEQVRP